MSVLRGLAVVLLSIALFASGAVLAHIGLEFTKEPVTAVFLARAEILRGDALQLDSGETVAFHAAAAQKTGAAAACDTVIAEDATYSAEVMSVTVPEQLTPGDLASITVKLQNTGTGTWFHENSNCGFAVPLVHLGTDKIRDRASPLFVPDGQGWLNANRIQMTELSVAAGAQGTFTFAAQLPQQDDFLREYFGVVVEGIPSAFWLTEPSIKIDLTVGTPESAFVTLAQYYQFSGHASVLTGEPKIEVDLSDQKMFLKVGDTLLTEFPISSGAASTPTPTGNYDILFKNDVRISSQGTPYIMPNYMGFAGSGAYGIHALPSLSYDNGYFWTEALSHIGTPVSHGCIRLLPDDAKTVYDFAEIGTPVEVHY